MEGSPDGPGGVQPRQRSLEGQLPSKKDGDPLNEEEEDRERRQKEEEEEEEGMK